MFTATDMTRWVRRCFWHMAIISRTIALLPSENLECEEEDDRLVLCSKSSPPPTEQQHETKNPRTSTTTTLTTTTTKSESSRAFIESQLEFPQQEKEQRRKALSKTTTTTEPSSAAAPPKVEALLIGINYIGTSNALFGCIPDVENMKRYLTEHEDLSAVLVTTDRTLFQPTRANIIDAGRLMVQRLVQHGGTLFVHYSGHGSQARDSGGSGGDEVDGRDEALVPKDFQQAGLLLDDTLNDIFVVGMQEAPESARLFFFSDSCHSGSVLDLPFSYVLDKTAPEIVSVPPSRAIAAADGARRPHVVLISGCMDQQTSSDVTTSTGSYGALSNALQNIFVGGAHRANTLTWREFMKLLRVELINYSQVPILSSNTALDLDALMGF